MKKEEEEEKVGEGHGEGAPWYRLHLEFRSKRLSFLKIAQPFPQRGWQQGLREARLPFYGKKIPDPPEGAGLELVVLDEAQPWGRVGQGWVGAVTWWDCLAWVAPPPVKKGLGWQPWSPSVGVEGLLRDIWSTPSLCFMRRT